MRKGLILGTVSSLGLVSAATAEVPSVATDIPPVHSLAAMVMAGLGEPALLVQPGASPHGYSLRPSEARALDEADAVFWIGESLTPWLQDPLETLAGDARTVSLMAVEGTTLLPMREGATFEAHLHDHGDDHGHDHGGDHDHDHGDDHGHGDDHAHDHGDGHEHGEPHDHDHDHAEGDGHDHGDDHGHDHGEAHDHDHDHGDHDHGDHDHGAGHDHAHGGHSGSDPHVWLDPGNARVWLGAIAETLSELDPENAARYRENAASAQAELDMLIGSVSAELEPVRERPFVVFHDAYQYFEQRFGMAAAGSISLSDSTAPSPARIAEVHQKVSELGVACVFSEPQFNPGLVRTVLQGTEAGTGIIDPLGADLKPGTGMYPALIQTMADTLRDCLG
ncbi:zinc ABC transporter substrate-binding protein [Ponticoccus litoralis]|uniref:High-affinity zinc uptake system protein ZnuA n=1 Tax=Ponticoccus litoralis TaxID=422297 RepID=A0AAW9ST59_9RHOB